MVTLVATDVGVQPLGCLGRLKLGLQQRRAKGTEILREREELEGKRAMLFERSSRWGLATVAINRLPAIRGPSPARVWAPVVGLMIAVLSASSRDLAADQLGGNQLGGNWPCAAVQMPASSGRGAAPVVTTVCLQPGGALLAAGGDDHRIYLWDVAAGQTARCLIGHEDWVHAVKFSADGRILASAGHDGRVILWDPGMTEPICVLDQNCHAVTELAWSQDGTRLATSGFSAQVRLYDIPTRKLVGELQGPCNDLRALSFSPDGQSLAAGGRNGKMRIWHLRGGQGPEEYTAHQGRIRALAFSPNGRLLASSGEDGKVHIWSFDSRSGRDLPRRPAKIFSLAFFGPNELAAGGSDNLIRLWDLSTGQEVGQLAGHQGSVMSLDSNGQILVSGSYDTVVRIWTIKDRVASAPRPTTELK